MDFEYDPDKSVANHRKRGIDFVDAQRLWQDPMRVEAPARTEDEPRWLIVGRIGMTHYSAAITYRQNTIRLISVRRSRKEEVAIYEG